MTILEGLDAANLRPLYRVQPSHIPGKCCKCCDASVTWEVVRDGRDGARFLLYYKTERRARQAANALNYIAHLPDEE